MQVGHLRQPAIDPALAAAGNEDDPAVGQIAGLDVVVGPVGQLPQIAAVEIDFVEMIAKACRPCDRKRGFFRRRSGPPDRGRPLLVFEDRRDGAGGQVEPAQLAAVAVGEPGLAVGVVAEVGVPVRVAARLPHGKDDLRTPWLTMRRARGCWSPVSAFSSATAVPAIATAVTNESSMHRTGIRGFLSPWRCHYFGTSTGASQDFLSPNQENCKVCFVERNEFRST